MSRFGRSDYMSDEVVGEFDFNEQGDVETEPVVNESVEVPEVVEPDVEPTAPEKVDRRGQYAGGSDYVYYGNF